MNTQAPISGQGDDSLDSLLAAQPVQPSQDFTRLTLDRIRAEAARDQSLDTLIDTCLATLPVEPRSGMANRVHASLREPADRKILGFPSWVAALGGIAALFVAGVIAFASMIRLATVQQTQTSTTAVQGITQVAMLPVEAQATAIATASNSLTSSSPDLTEMEELLMMEAAFRDIAAVGDNHGWQTLALLTY